MPTRQTTAKGSAWALWGRTWPWPVSGQTSAARGAQKPELCSWSHQGQARKYFPCLGGLKLSNLFVCPSLSQRNGPRPGFCDLDFSPGSALCQISDRSLKFSDPRFSHNTIFFSVYLRVVEILCREVHWNKVSEYYLQKCHILSLLGCLIIQLHSDFPELSNPGAGRQADAKATGHMR